MGAYGILLVGVLVVISLLIITSAIMSLAPYVAGTIVILGLFWIVSRSKTEKVEGRSTPPTKTQVETRDSTRERR